MDSHKLLARLDTLLETRDFPDYPGAHNGLQVQPPARIRRVATAVDICAATAHAAVAADADLLIVHHGLFWGGVQRLVGATYETFAPLLRRPCGLYAVHLPLDAHPLLGNNAILAGRIDLEAAEPFGLFAGRAIGLVGRTAKTDVAAVSRAVGIPFTEAIAPATAATAVSARRVAIVSGNGGSLIEQAAQAGADVLLTGEVDHHDRVRARDLRLGLWLGGHYATETFGVRALGDYLAAEDGVEHVFVDMPSGG